MTIATEAGEKIDAYLERLRGRLRGLDAESVREIVAELRSHILDRAATAGEVTLDGVEAALAALGSPEQLAGDYQTDAMLAGAEASRSPVKVLDGLFRWASLSVAGFVVLVGSVFGYFTGGVLIVLAVMKPYHPQTAGLWTWRDRAGDLVTSFRMGFDSPPAGAREVLGWWAVPIGLIAGCALVVLTTRFALWCARLYRKSRALPRG